MGLSRFSKSLSNLFMSRETSAKVVLNASSTECEGSFIIRCISIRAWMSTFCSQVRVLAKIHVLWIIFFTGPENANKKHNAITAIRN